MSKPVKQIHLAAHFPGVNNTTVWSDPTSGSQIDFSSFVHLAQTAERGKFDFFFLAEGLRLREHRGQIFDLDVVGRPDSLTVLSGLAAVTDKIGLAATLNTTFNEPYELARQFATLDHLSNGRAAWNAVTSPDAFTGENFRRGGFLDHARRYDRAAEFIATAHELWDSWEDDPIVADAERGVYVRPGAIRTFDHEGDQFSIRGRFNIPPSPQRYPVQIQAGDSDGGRELAAQHADVIFSRHAGFRDGQAFYVDVKERLARYGRSPDDLKIIPAAVAVLGDSEADATERAHEIHRQQVSPQGAIAFLEQIWNRDLSGYDPDGPLPVEDPDVESEISITHGRVRHVKDPLTVATKWRELAEAKSLSIRELIIEVRRERRSWARHPGGRADLPARPRGRGGRLHLRPAPHPTWSRRVHRQGGPRAARPGVFRSEYEQDTLRGHLGLAPVRPAIVAG